MKAILITFLVFLNTADAGKFVHFKSTYKRYLSGHDLFRVLRQKFPQKFSPANLNGSKHPECEALTERTKLYLGVSQPASGENLYPSISPNFVRWFTKCTQIIVQEDLELTFRNIGGDPNGPERYFGKDAIEAISKSPYKSVLQDPKSIRWRQLELSQKKLIALHLVRELIGIGVVSNEMDLVEKLIAFPLEEAESALSGLSKLVLWILLQEEFLTY